MPRASKQFQLSTILPPATLRGIVATLLAAGAVGALLAVAGAPVP
jgi:hypothetical protein